MKNIFTEHPRSIGETYFVHFKFAIRLGINLMFTSIIYIVHAFFPFLFQKTGSTILIKMAHRVMVRRAAMEHDVADLFTMMEDKKANPHKI